MDIDYTGDVLALSVALLLVALLCRRVSRHFNKNRFNRKLQESYMLLDACGYCVYDYQPFAGVNNPDLEEALKVVTKEHGVIVLNQDIIIGHLEPKRSERGHMFVSKETSKAKLRLVVDNKRLRR